MFQFWKVLKWNCFGSFRFEEKFMIRINLFHFFLYLILYISSIYSFVSFKKSGKMTVENNVFLLCFQVMSFWREVWARHLFELPILCLNISNLFNRKRKYVEKEKKSIHQQIMRAKCQIHQYFFWLHVFWFSNDITDFWYQSISDNRRLQWIPIRQY